MPSRVVVDTLAWYPSHMQAITVIEPVSYLILAFAAYAAFRRGTLRTFLVEGAFISVGGLIAELSIMHAYGFYEYSPDWAVFVDRMPLTVVLIWGYVISSARELAGFFHPRRPAWLVGALVLFDAALIETVASRAGLWTWYEGGLWGVSWSGWIGWGFYAAAISWCLDRPGLKLFSPLLATLATHLALIVLWWGALRWFARDTAPEFLLVGASILCSLALTAAALRARLPPLWVLIPRAPAGLIFFAILPLAQPTASFIAFVLPFAAPWFVLCARAWKERQTAVTRTAQSVTS